MVRMMKNSGVEWIGAIPEEWRLCKLKNIIEFKNGYAFDSSVLSNDGKYPVIRIGDIKDGGIDIYNANKISDNKGLENFLIKDKDILLAMSGATVGKLGYVDNIETECYINQRVGIIRAENSKYIYYYLSTDEFIKYVMLLSAGSAQPNISTENVNNYYLSFPYEEEQIKIVTFLDEKVGVINEIISKTNEAIEEYKKYRNSLISEKIIFGMDSSMPMKKSGVDWCPQIPEHWNVINPKVLFALRKDKAKEGDRQLTASQKKGIMYQDEYMDSEGVRVVVVQKDFDILKHVEPGDFVISMRSFQGGLEYSELRGCISSAYVMLIPNRDRVYSPFYKWFFKSSKYINAIQSTSNLVRDGQAMRYSNFAQVPLLDIPLDEQKEIANYLDMKCAEIDALIAKKKKFVEEMITYKKSLIYEYVTGKKEVPVC